MMLVFQVMMRRRHTIPVHIRSCFSVSELEALLQIHKTTLQVGHPASFPLGCTMFPYMRALSMVSHLGTS